MGQYFDNDLSLDNNPIDIYFQINSRPFHFTSLPGVFSNKHLDMGSRLLIEQVLKLNLTGKVLDLGCGYGVIGLTILAFKPHCVLTCADINERACVCTRTNANSMKLSVSGIVVSDGFANIPDLFDFIILNPPIRAGKKVIYPMFLEAQQHLNENGSLIIVIRKDQGAISAHRYITDIFGNGELLSRDRGYHIYQYIKRS